jgi:hypothetical protein
MAQIKIYGIAEHLNPIKARLSDVIHACVVEALQFPPDKRAHRFFPLDPSDFYYPDGRTDLRLVERGRELVFGRFLNDDERRGLASELKAALLQARGGARI